MKRLIYQVYVGRRSRLYDHCVDSVDDYCKEHKLQKEEDKRVLIPDATLSKLLRLKKGDELTFFNLQKYMKVHFPNKEGVFPTA